MAHLDNSEAAGGYSLEVLWEEIRETAGYNGHDFSVGLLPMDRVVPPQRTDIRAVPESIYLVRGDVTQM